MFIDYKLENCMFRLFIGHRQVFSKITYDHSMLVSVHIVLMERSLHQVLLCDMEGFILEFAWSGRIVLYYRAQFFIFWF